MKQVSKEPLVSIIIPVYNVEPYLARCLDTVVSQSYKNLEIIIVNDGSTDNSGKICDEYAKKDKRIKVVHKKNGGLSDARNKGIKIATGEFISFIDSDDYVEKKFIKTAIAASLKNESDIVICAHKTISKKKTIDPEDGSIRNYKKEQILDKMLYADPIVGVSVWAKLFKKDLFSGILFPKGKKYEDTRTTYKLYDKADKITVVSKSLYNYCLRTDSLTQKSYNQDATDIIMATAEIQTFIKRKYPEMEQGANRRMAWAYLSSLAKAIREKEKDECAKIRKSLKTISKSVLLDKKANLKDKIGIIASMFGNKPYIFCWNMYNQRKGIK